MSCEELIGKKVQPVSAPAGISDNKVVRGTSSPSVLEETTVEIDDSGNIDFGAAGIKDDNVTVEAVLKGIRDRYA